MAAEQQVKKRNNLIAMLLPALVCLGCIILYHTIQEIIKPKNKFDNVRGLLTSQITSVDADIAGLNERIGSTRMKIVELQSAIQHKAADLVDPGAEPNWFFHPFEHKKWEARNSVYVALKDEILELRSRVGDFQVSVSNFERKCESLDVRRLNLRDKLREADSPANKLTFFFRIVWNDYVRVFLHLLLSVSILALSVRAAFRTVLLNGRIGIAQI